MSAQLPPHACFSLQISPDGEALIEELGGGFHPVMDDEREREDLRFVVRDDEVSVGRFISEEEAARLAAEKAATEAQMAKNAADNSTARALTMMMGGTLERPDDGMAEFAVERPVWLDTDPKAWGAEQLKEYKEYEAKQKAATEEMAKKIQTVETELRTLKVCPSYVCWRACQRLGDGERNGSKRVAPLPSTITGWSGGHLCQV